MKTRFLFAMLLLLAAGCGLHGPSARPHIRWFSLKEGIAAAGRTGKPCLVDFFYGPQCPRCRVFIDSIYSDPAIAARIERDFVPVRIDLTSPLIPEETRLSEEMETGGECMLLFLDSRGRPIRRSRDSAPICSMEAMDKKEFTAILDEALAAAGR